MKAKKPCTYPGCGALTHSTRCDIHKHVEAKAYDKARGTAASRGYGWKWTQASKRFRREHPFCRICWEEKCILVPTEQGGHVDHIIPVTGPDDPRFWDESNWQSICGTCHSAKTAKEDGGFTGRRIK